MSVLQSEFAISLITIFYLKTNFILHPYFFAYKKNTLSFLGKLILFFNFCDIILYYKNSHV